jgi:hypothetical protein
VKHPVAYISFVRGCGCFDNCVGGLVICVLVFTAFCIVVLCFFIVSFMYNYSYWFIGLV